MQHFPSSSNSNELRGQPDARKEEKINVSVSALERDGLQKSLSLGLSNRADNKLK